MKWPLHTLFLISFILLSCAPQQFAQAQVLSLQHPDDSSKKVEYFLEKPPNKGPWPTVIFLHGHQEDPRPGGKVFLDGRRLTGGWRPGLQILCIVVT